MMSPNGEAGAGRLAYESLTERAMAAIRVGIASGTYTPGTLYSGYRIAEELGISRSPVREALLRLAEDGIVRFERNRGFFVNRPDAHDLVEIFGIRLALEVSAAKRAALTGDHDFAKGLEEGLARMSEAVREGDEAGFSVHDQELHDAILRQAGNGRVRRIISKLRDETRLLGAVSAPQDRTLREVHDEHVPIVEAIHRGDGDAAAAAMKQHLASTASVLLKRALQDFDDHVDIAEIWDLSRQR